MAFPNENAPVGIHTAMFKPALNGQMTDEQKAKWLPLAENWEIIGTYAQTELGHGTSSGCIVFNVMTSHGLHF